MRNQTTMKLGRDEAELLLDALLGQHLENLSDEEISNTDRLVRRLRRALDRL